MIYYSYLKMQNSKDESILGCPSQNSELFSNTIWPNLIKVSVDFFSIWMPKFLVESLGYNELRFGNKHEEWASIAIIKGNVW